MLNVEKNNCEFWNIGVCAGCVGLGEDDWIGSEQCERYQKLKSMNQATLCKKLLSKDIWKVRKIKRQGDEMFVRQNKK